MVTFSLFERGWRDAFWGREPAEADPSYLEGFAAGLTKGDRTRKPVPAPASSVHADEAGSLPEEAS